MLGGRARLAAGFLLASCAMTLLALAPANAREAAVKFRNVQLEPLSFAALDGWRDDDQAEAFTAFLTSCRAILNGTKAMRAARPVFDGLYKICQRAKTAGSLDRDGARAFFEANFKPVRVTPAGQPGGFFTGYYETEVEGSRVKTAEFSVPIYRSPIRLSPNSKRSVVSRFDRTQIENGALAGKNLEICWVKSPIDAFFAQIQGSTRVKLDNGALLRLNYIGSNGLPYTPVGRILIDRGIFSKEEMSMDKIREWMEANPEEAVELRRKNRSFVFFQETDLAPHDECIGAQGVPLTPLRSLAVDKSLHVYGTPIWVDADLPIESEKPETKFRRLLFAQDTGSAIRGAARADIYFGHGEEVSHIAGRIKQFGQFVMLVPRELSVKDDMSVPLPKPRPAAAQIAAAGRKQRP